MTESLSTGAALTLPTPPLPPSRTDEKRIDAASPAAGTAQKAARWLQERSSSKEPLTIALQRQRTRSDIPHSSGNRTTSDRNPRSGSNKASNISSNKGTDVFSSEAMLRAKGKAAADALEVEDISVRDVTPFSTRSAPTPQLYAANNKQQIGSQSSTTSTAARKTTHPAKPAALLSPAVGSGPTSLPQPGGAGLLSSSKRGLSPGVSSETVKQSLLGSLLMPDGVTVRKPPPLGISSGDPIGTHILRRRATSMRTEKFSSSGLNLSLHRHAAANNSMLSWQRSFQSGPRGAASFSSPSSAYGSSYNRRARGNSFMGRPIETLPRLVAFSPSLSKALQQQAHLIPAPPVIDSACAGPAAADAVSLSTAGASSVVPTIATSRPPGAASSSPNAETVFPGNVALSLAGTRARDKVPQDKGEKATVAVGATGPSRDQVTTAAVATTTTAAAVFNEEAAGKIGDTTASHVEIVGELEGPKVLHDDETVTASYCAAKTPGRVCYSSSVNSSSSAFEVRRRVGGGADETLRKTGQANCSALQHPTDILSHTTFDHSHSDSSSSSSEGSSTRSSRGDRTSTKASSSSRSASCWPTAHENVTDVTSEVRTSLAASRNDVVVAGTSGAPATSSAGSGIFPSDSSFTQMIEVTTSVSVRPPAEAASSPPSSVEAEHLQEKTGGPQSERPILSPALLYQLGITKFTEGRAPEAIEAITRFLRDAAAKKRRQQRQTAESSSSTCPTQPRAGNVVTVHILKERHGEKEDAAISSPPAEGDPSMTATNALAKEKQQGDEKSEKLAVCSALIDGDTAGEEETESKVSKVQDLNSSISYGRPLSWSSSRTDATAVSSGKSVALDETSVTATKGHDGDACGHLACDASSFKDVGVLTGACEETQQQEREQEAHLQLQGGKEPARGKASDKDDAARKETNVREGATVKLKAQQVSAVQLNGDATAAETTRSHAHPQGSRQDFQGRTIREGFTAEKDIDAGVDGSHSPKPFALPGTTQSAAADAAAPDTTAGDATATDPTAAHAASPDTTAAEATAAEATAAEATAAGATAAGADAAGATGAGATAAGATADDATAADAVAADADADAAHTTAVDADVFNLQKTAVQGNEEAKGGADGETGRTEGHQDDAGAFDELEAVPVQNLFGVVYGRRMQIDRRAKDLIAGWGTPQYFHLEKLLGHLLFEEGDFAEAVRHYWRNATCTLLGARSQMGATEEAMASFEQALKCNDRNPVALSVLAMLLMDKFEDAEELSHQEAENAEQEELTRLSSAFGAFYRRVAQLPQAAHETERLERLLKGTDRCVTLLKRCVEVEEDNVLAVLHLAQVYMYREEWDKAEAIFRALLQENADDTHLLNNLGQIAMNKGDTRQALQLFERALQINPQDELAHMHMCEAFCSLQHLGRALQHFRLCCEASPDSVSLHATCGLPLCEAGKEKEVVAAYTKFIKQYPESVAAKTFKRSLGSSNDQVGFLESSQIIVFIVLPILLLMVFLIGFTQLVSYWSSPTDDRSLPASWESVYYTSPADSSS